MFSPTTEQLQALDAFRSGDDLVIEAAAGAGKTSTLHLLAQDTASRKGLYLAFNNTVEQEAKAKFNGTSVTASTFHALAFNNVPAELTNKLGKNKNQFNSRVQALLGINERFQFGPGDNSNCDFISKYQIQKATQDTVSRFMSSSDFTLERKHVELPKGFSAIPRVVRDLRTVILDFAKLYWQDICDPLGKLHFDHEAYLKLYQLSKPVLPVDYVLFDEAQDADPLMLSILERQTCQKVIVGDRGQAIYGWRGAVDSLEAFPHARRAQLTQSWRFGQAGAEEAQKWLDMLGIDMKIQGNPELSTRVTDRYDHSVDVVLTRSNAQMIKEAAAQLSEGKSVYIEGGKVQAFRDLARARIELDKHQRTGHPDFSHFSSWEQIVELSTTPAGKDYAPGVKTVTELGAEPLIRLLDSCRTPNADITVSTTHVAKGLEWHRVRIAEDFFAPRETDRSGEFTISEPELRLGYVAVTRAKTKLLRGPLKWIDSPPKNLRFTV